MSLQEYLEAGSPLSLDFAVRTRGLDLKSNFKAGRTDLNCRLCKENLKDQKHLLTCPALVNVVRTQATSQPPYSDIFSQLKQITKVLHDKFSLFSIQVNRLPKKKSISDAKVSNVNDDTKL